MNLKDFKNITDFEIFKQKLEDFDNWRGNYAHEWEEEIDAQILLYIQRNYVKFLNDITDPMWASANRNNTSWSQVENISWFILTADFEN